MEVNSITSDNVDISILVTFYNQLKYIEQSLTSIISQKTDYSFEVLCGDDGSQDGTYEELQKWAKQYPSIIHVYRMPREAGRKYEPIIRVSHNRLNLLKNAKGRYICFLDGDDFYINDNKIQKQIDLLEKNLDCVACGHPFQVYMDDTRQYTVIQNTMLPSKTIKFGMKMYWSFIWLHADTFVFRNTFNNIADIINEDIFDDNLITAYFIKHGSIIYLPDAMVAYRQIGKSSWNSRDDLQKAYVNMRMYYEAARLFPKDKLYSFFRCFDAWRIIYNNRNTAFTIDPGMIEIEKIPFVHETMIYHENGLAFKIKYEIKYGIILRMKFFIKILRKLKFCLYRKVRLV